MSIIHFQGATAVSQFRLLDAEYIDEAISPATDAQSTIAFEADGELRVDALNTPSGPVSGQWFAPPQAGIGAQFEIRATVLSGVTPTGSAVATWLSLSSERAWTVSRSGAFGVTSSELLIAIRSAVSSTVILSATITIQAITAA